MKLQKEILILGAIILALAVYLFQRSSDRTHYTLPALPELAAADITKIQITRPDGTLALVRRENRWVLDPQGYPVDSKSAQEMLDTISGLTLTALVAESQNYALYELDDEHKVNVKAWQNDQLTRDVDVGKAAASFRHTFLRLAGDERVFQAEDNFSFRFRTAVADLRDKTVLAFNRQDIREVQISSGDQTATFTRVQPKKEDPAGGAAAAAETAPPAQPAANGWHSSDKRPVRSAAVQSLLAELSNLQCEAFIENATKSAFSNPVYTVILKGPQEHTLSIFAPVGPDTKDHPAVSSGSDYVFRLSQDHAQRVMKKPEEFFKAEEKTEPN